MELLIVIIVVITITTVFILRSLIINKKREEQKAKLSETGIYVIDGANISPLNELPGNGSINSIIKMLGYPETYTILSCEIHEPLLFRWLVIERRTLKPIFFEMKDKSTAPSYKDLSEEIKRVDWDFVKRQIQSEDNITRIEIS